MKKFWIVFPFLITMLLMFSCAPGPNQMAGTPDAGGNLAGFWTGLWQGFIALFSFIISLFTDSVRIYEVHNNGNWYNLGYLLGLMIFFGGSGGGAGKRACR